MTRRQLLVVGGTTVALAPVAWWFGSPSVANDDEAKRFPFELTDDAWRGRLQPQQYRVLREGWTEPAGTSPLNGEKREGTFVCAGCAQPLFASSTKFESGTGWPSFFAPIDGAVGTEVDRSYFMVRTEVHCSNCGGHLGHVFPDGPRPTGLRYCMNGAALAFVAGAAAAGDTASATLQIATFASGCFWCTESDFDRVPGVVSTTSGYIGGRVVNPTYNQVSAGGTGHVEAVEVRFDPARVTYAQLLDVYWHNVDPFTRRGQFCDFGEQYRPAIWVHGPEQRAAADASKQRMQELFERPIEVTVEDATRFYRAEEYHQDFHTQSSVRYRYYRWGCGRDSRLADIWRDAPRPY